MPIASPDPYTVLAVVLAYDVAMAGSLYCLLGRMVDRVRLALGYIPKRHGSRSLGGQ